MANVCGTFIFAANYTKKIQGLLNNSLSVQFTTKTTVPERGSWSHTFV